MIIIETNRLMVRQLCPEDAPFILALTNTAGWLQYIGDRGVRNIADAENYISSGPMASYAKSGHGLCLAVSKETGMPLGICGIIKRDTLEDRDLGFAFMPQYTGNGYALEAAAAILQHAREKLNIQRIVAITLESNSRSIGLLTKLGFSFEKKVRLPGSDEELMLFANERVLLD